jgi:5-(carboxyamino)imidazole ribonucleotide synthase
MSARFELGVLGGGQLARMTMLAAHRLGVSVASYDPDPQCPAAQVGAHVQGALNDADRMQAFLSRCQAAVLDSEFVPVATIRAAIADSGFDSTRLVPNAEFLAVIQDKLAQRERYRAGAVPSPDARALDGTSNPPAEYPVVLKSRFGGYDGKGTRVIRTRDEWDAVVDIRASGGWLEEAYVPFTYEVAVMVARAGEHTVAYPPVITVQPELVCEFTVPFSDAAASVRAQRVAVAAVEAIAGPVPRGLFGVELFFTATGDFVVNEIAPRPHNTGHATMDDAGTSQFEQLVRIAIGLPLGPVEPASVGMANLLGPASGEADGAVSPERLRAARAAVYQIEPAARVHWYGKSEVRVGRKLGHVNVPGVSGLEDLRRLQAVAAAFWHGYVQ